MKVFPILLRPRAVGALNRWRRSRKATGNLIRDILLACFGLVVMYAIYRGTRIGLTRIDAFSDFAYLPPATPLSVLLLFLFGMLILSCAVMALGTFFLSMDHSLILSAPVPRWVFFFSKGASVLLSTAWMPLSFLLPFLLAFGHHYNGTFLYYLGWPLVLIPYFSIPASLAFLISLVVITLVPPSQTRLLLGMLIVLLMYFLIHAGFIISSGLNTGGDLGELMRILTVLSFPDALWLPSHWAALALDELLERNFAHAVAPIGLLWIVGAGLLSLSYGLFSVLFPLALSRSTNRRRALLNFQLLSPVKRWLSLARGFLPFSSPSLMLKDYRVLFRDMPQVVQVLLLLMIYLVYLYNLRVFGLIDALNEEERSSWLAFFFIANASMGAFVTTATATRLVFPSISLEGRSFWVLQTAPISIRQILVNKFWTWFIPIGLLSSVTFAAGNIALGTGVTVVWATFVVGWFLSAGLISLGLGIGSVFARYDWEHSAQLVASFGSFVFMLASIFLITVNMVPLGIALYIREPGMLGEGMDYTSWVTLLVACSVFILLVNSLVVELSLSAGERALVRHMKESG